MRLSSPLQGLALAVLAALCAPSQCRPNPRPHGGGWVPSGAWTSPASFGAVNPVSTWPASGWTDYSVGVDPWAAQVVKKKPSYASLYPWAQKPVYHQTLAIHSPAPSHHHHATYDGWTKIPVVDEETSGQWVAWVPEEFGDYVIVRKDKLKPKKKKIEIEEEEAEEPEPPKPKKKKVKTTVEEEEEVPERPSKKKTTIVEEETEPQKKVTATKVEEETTSPKKTTKTTVTKETPGTVKKTETEVVQTATGGGSAPAPGLGADPAAAIAETAAAAAAAAADAAQAAAAAAAGGSK